MQVNPLLIKPKEQVESKKKKKQKEKKQKHENVMKDLPPSAFSCIAHPTQYLRVMTKGSKNPPSCKACGFKLSGLYGYFACPKSANCFHLCSTCKICSKNHMLRLVISLKQFKNNPLYAQNKFNCHGCTTDKTLDQRGVWHCGTCGFSICPDCMDKTNALWDQDLVTDQNEKQE